MQHVTTTRSMWWQFFLFGYRFSHPAFSCLGQLFCCRNGEPPRPCRFSRCRRRSQSVDSYTNDIHWLIHGGHSDHFTPARRKQNKPYLYDYSPSSLFSNNYRCYSNNFRCSHTPPLLDMLSLQPEVHNITYRFLLYIGLGIIPTFVSITLRNIVDSHGLTRLSLAIMTCGFLSISFSTTALFTVSAFSPKWVAPAPVLLFPYPTFLTAWLFAVNGIFQTIQPVPSIYIEKIRTDIWIDQLKIGLPIGCANFLKSACLRSSDC